MAVAIASPCGEHSSTYRGYRRSPRPKTTPLLNDAQFSVARNIELASIKILKRKEEEPLTTTTTSTAVDEDQQECGKLAKKVEKFKVVKFSKRRYELERRYYAGGVSISGTLAPPPDALPLPGFLSHKKNIV